MFIIKLLIINIGLVASCWFISLHLTQVVSYGWYNLAIIQQYLDFLMKFYNLKKKWIIILEEPEDNSLLKSFHSRNCSTKYSLFHHHHHRRRFVSSSSSSSSSTLQLYVGLGLLKQMSPASCILGIRPPISTTQFPCVFLHPANPSRFQSATSSFTSRVCPQYLFR